MSQNVIGSGTNGTSPLVITLSSGAAVGERVVVGIHTMANTSFAIADSKSNVWTLKHSVINGNGSTNLRLYETVVTNALVATDTITCTMTGATGSNTAIAVRITDVLDTTKPVERVSGFTAGGTALNWITELHVPKSDDFVALCFVTNSSARTNTATAPWTELTELAGTGSRPLAAQVVDSLNAWQNIASGGTFNLSGSNTYSIGIVYNKSGYTLNTPEPIANGSDGDITGSFGAELTPNSNGLEGWGGGSGGSGGAPVPTEGQLWPRGNA